MAKSKARLVAVAVLGLVGGREAFAQNAPVPKFAYAKPEEAPASEWKAQAKGSLLLTSGNSQSKNAVLGLTASRQTGDNKFSFEGQVAYGRSSVVVPTFDPANPTLIVALGRREDTTTNQWQTRARYDRFFTENNAGYLLGQLGADKIAGKELIGGGQIGYSRQLYKSDRHTAVAELGYDFSYERYVSQMGMAPKSTQIHSARAFLGELFALTSATALTGSLEVLTNLNKENAANANRSDERGLPLNEVDAFKDTRVVGKAGLTTTLWKNLSFGFGVTLRYDQNPAPRPVPSGYPGAMFAVPQFSDEVDTLTEATLVFTFL